MIELELNWNGLPLQAEVLVTGRYHPGSFYEPPDFPEWEVRSLTCMGKDAMFMIEYGEWGLEGWICDRALEKLRREELEYEDV